MYREVNLTATGTLFDCKTQCFSEPGLKCKVFAFEPPVCYLGNPAITGTITTIDKTVNLFANYGNFEKFT